MKKILILTLAVLVLAAAPAYAALKILPEEVQERLHNLALAQLPGYQVEESWVQEFPATGREVFRIILIKGTEKAEVFVDIAVETLLSEEGFAEIVAAEEGAQAVDPVFTTMNAEDTDLLISPAPIREERDPASWLGGGLVALTFIGGIALYLKKRP